MIVKYLICVIIAALFLLSQEFVMSAQKERDLAEQDALIEQYNMERYKVSAQNLQASSIEIVDGEMVLISGIDKAKKQYNQCLELLVEDPISYQAELYVQLKSFLEDLRSQTSEQMWSYFL